MTNSCLGLSCFGHIWRSSDLAKIILQDPVKGKKRRGRYMKRSKDNIKEWTGMSFAAQNRAASDNTIWKGNVAK